MSVAIEASPTASILAFRVPGRVWFASGFVGIAIAAAVLRRRAADRVLDRHRVPVRRTAQLARGTPCILGFAAGSRRQAPRLLLPVSLTGILGLDHQLRAAAVGHARRAFSTSAVAGRLYACWNTTFLFWIATLIWMRSRTNPKFDGGWVWPLACLLCAGVWLEPFALNVALVYCHPLMALWLLDRELTRSRPQWRRTYRCVIACVPLLLGILWWQLHDAEDLPGSDTVSAALQQAIVNHSCAWYFENVSTHFLVAAHTFLEMVHYGVWIVLIPLIGMRTWPWRLHTIPAARRSPTWTRGVGIFLLFGLCVVVTLWVCFDLDYTTTRNVYFSVAMLHVLAEVPFLLRMT